MKKIFKASIICSSLLFGSDSVRAQQVSDRIQLNQVGFYPKATKLAAIIGDVSNGSFFITSTNLADTLYRGTLKDAKTSTYSPLVVRVADFSPLQQEGSFVLTVPGLGHSYPFQVSVDVHREAAIASLKGFYYQRISMPLEKRYAGKWHRSAGHLDNVVYVHPSAASKERPAGTVLSAVGGWYDAGDYNKYIVNSGITMGTLLSAYEDFPAYFDRLNVNIPESENVVPDLLDEVVYNLRWMLTMQDPTDGGVYHKCTNADFDGMVMPGVTKAPRFLVQKGTAAALDFAAVMAQASRVYQKYNTSFPGLVDSCAKAALAAWNWALRNPSVVYSQKDINSKHKPAITTGEYGDKNFKDEWLWAAAELFATTKEKRFYDTVAVHLKDVAVLPSWASVGLLGYYTLLRFRTALPSYTKPGLQVMQDTVVRMANEFLKGMQRNVFNVVMGQTARDFVWGSNAVAANQGILLVNAFKFTNDSKYIEAALHNIDYLFGRNATGYSFFTGIGSKTPMHPHHRQSEADGIIEPVPGLLSGGPNPGMQDKCNYPYKDPERAFTDVACSYASNEIAINWNAPAVYLLNSIEALQQRVNYVRVGQGLKNTSKHLSDNMSLTAKANTLF